MSANDIQVGGDHYKAEYQHWDWVCDIELHYLLAVATKYVIRWRNKNGVQDLNKAAHFLRKAIEKELVPPDVLVLDRAQGDDLTKTFMKQYGTTEISILLSIYFGNYEAAIGKIQDLQMDVLKGDVNVDL